MHGQTFRPKPRTPLQAKGISLLANSHPVLPTTSKLYSMALEPTRAWPLMPLRLPLPRCPSTSGLQGHVSCSGVSWVAGMALPPPPHCCFSGFTSSRQTHSALSRPLHHATDNSKKQFSAGQLQQGGMDQHIRGQIPASAPKQKRSDRKAHPGDNDATLNIAAYPRTR